MSLSYIVLAVYSKSTCTHSDCTLKSSSIIVLDSVYFFRASDLLFLILFADDTTVLIAGQNYNNIIFTLSTELQKLDVWLQANKLSLINKYK